MKTNRIMKSYRFNREVLNELKEILKNKNMSETSFIEIAIIEKMARIRQKELNIDKYTI